MAIENAQRSEVANKALTIRTIAMAVGFLLALATTVVGLPRTAHARCDGVGTLVTSRLIIDSETYVFERPQSGTCDGNALYRATVSSGQRGWSAFVAVRSAGTSNWVRPPDSTYVVDSRNRPPELRSFRLLLCTTNGAVNRCGWGSQYRSSIVGEPLNTTYTGVVSGY
jgi:hypothetical protein